MIPSMWRWRIRRVHRVVTDCLETLMTDAKRPGRGIDAKYSTKTRRNIGLLVACVLIILAGVLHSFAQVIAIKPANSAERSEPSLEDPRLPAETVADPVAVRRAVVTSKQPKNVLVTGAAGFIGFHLASALADYNGGRHNVVGIDNFNDYYDVRLKHARAKTLLKSRGVVVHRGDVCDERILRSLMTSHGITHVVHLAAMVGVRFSAKDPLSYVTANVECFTRLLVVLDQFPAAKLVYASSSSVYGVDSPIPFAVPWPPSAAATASSSSSSAAVGDESLTCQSASAANTDESAPPAAPNNMYAATKVTGEVLAAVHCNKRRRNFASASVLDSAPVGLRFFTVYGPWGRPDMATFGFAEAMMAGRSIRLFQAEGNRAVSRDFSYVDDIISGILAAIDYKPSACGEVFNLGPGKPTSVLEMIRILENELNLTANIVKERLPPTDVVQTFANNTDSEIYLNYKPKFSLRQGIRSFVEWFRSYKQNKFFEVIPTDE